MAEDFLFSADGHIMEPPDLFLTRLPKHLREMAVWEENFEIEPLGDDGFRYFKKLHTPGFEGWSSSRFRHKDGTPNTGQPDRILEDFDYDGIWGGLMHPNLSLFGLYSDHHELSIAHARVYNDYIAETFAGYGDRLFPTAPIPLTDIDDAVAEIERVAALGSRVILLPSTPPMRYSSPDFDRVWAAATDNSLLVAIHVATGGVKVNDPEAATLQAMMEGVRAQGHDELDDRLIVDRMYTAAAYAPMVPQKIIASLVGGGVCERFPDLHIALIEFNANWLVSAVAAMDKAWTLGVGQDRDWWVGTWHDDHAPSDQPEMAQLFRLNERWPYPLKPSEYVQRQIHVSFQEDPVAVACRHITGITSLVWGADYPHAEGTFMRSRARRSTPVRRRRRHRAAGHPRRHARRSARRRRTRRRLRVPMGDLTYESTSRTLETPQGTLHYHEAGDGPPLLLLHGSGPGVSGWANFRGNLAAFAEHFRTLVLDMPGFGKSYSCDGNPLLAAPPGSARLPRRHGRSTRSRSSATRWAATWPPGWRAGHPERVQPPRHDRRSRAGAVQPDAARGHQAAGAVRRGPDARAADGLDGVDGVRHRDPHRRVRRDAVAGGDRPGRSGRDQEDVQLPGAGRDAPRAAACAADQVAMLAKIEAPTLITWGRDDRVTPLDSVLVPMRLIKRCEVHVFHDCGHWAMIERKDEFESVMLSFLRRPTGA